MLLVDDLRLGPVSSVLPKTLSDSRGLDISAAEMEVLSLLGILHQVTTAHYDTVLMYPFTTILQRNNNWYLYLYRLLYEGSDH